jgi:glycine/D-amino acid oxidase-like deaminating enzyme
MERLLTQPQENVAVIGSGIAGCLAAQELAAAGYQVQVFEERDQAFSGTSATALQAHLGGLYSGSTETARECLHSAIEVKKAMPYALSDRNAMFLVAEQSELAMDDYIAFYEELAGYYANLPAEDRVFGHPDRFFRTVTAEECDFAKNIEGGIVTQEPGLDMARTRTTLLGKLARLGVGIATNSEVIGVKTKTDGSFALSVKTRGVTDDYHFDQVVNAGGYKCRVLDHELGDRTNYNLSLEAKSILRDDTPGSALPPFYVVRGYFMHITPMGSGDVTCLNTATADGGYVDTATCDDNTPSMPAEWQEIMATGVIPDAAQRQRAMIEYANDNFLVGRQLEPVELVPGISTSFSAARQNRTQKGANIVVPGWQTIVPTKATHALELARQTVANALTHSAQAV